MPAARVRSRFRVVEVEAPKRCPRLPWDGRGWDVSPCFAPVAYLGTLARSLAACSSAWKGWNKACSLATPWLLAHSFRACEQPQGGSSMAAFSCIGEEVSVRPVCECLVASCASMDPS